jgi:hypothetical protein
MRIIVKARKSEEREVLESYVPYLRKILVSLSKGYKFKLPKEIILQPLRRHGKPPYNSWTFGRAGYGPRTGWYISMNIDLCKAIDRELDTLAHEAAHIAEARISGRWTHGELFEKLYARAKAIIPDRR